MPIDTLQSPPPFDAELAGFQFCTKDTKDLFISTMFEGMSLGLRRDEFNKYDAFAVEVYFETADEIDRLTTHKIGFINKEVSMMLCQWMDQGVEYSCKLVQFDEFGRNRHHLRCLPEGMEERPLPVADIQEDDDEVELDSPPDEDDGTDGIDD